jgi:serine/threonine-protein kinase
MSMPSARELLAFLQQHGFLTRSQLQSAADPKLADTRALARFLLEQNWLTAYQANQLLQGRGSELVLGPYRILEQLGEGGMGQVFKARHISMDRVVAVKVIPKNRVSEALAMGRFQQEVRAVAKLSHPNIVTAFEVNQIGDRHFLALEFVDGIDLARLVQQSGPLPIPKACEYIRQAAVGLQHAHEKGLVHRDIKPGNLMIARPSPNEPPVIKILDFGLARFESESGQAGRLTQLGHIVGTVDYIAPEQAKNPRTADIRADIYGLGCSLFYLLTGNPPFPGVDAAERIAARMRGDAPSVRTGRPEVSLALEQALAKMMARNPAERYQTPGEVAKSLEPHTDVPRSLGSGDVLLTHGIRPRTPVPPQDSPRSAFVFAQAALETPTRRKVKVSVWMTLASAVVVLATLLGVILLVNKKVVDTQVDKKSQPSSGKKSLSPGDNSDASAKIYLSQLNGFDWTGYQGLGKGSVTADNRDLKIAVNGAKYPLGLGMHPYSNNSAQVKFLLRGLKARSFKASVALNDTVETGESPLTFVALGDGKPLWTSNAVQKRHITQECSINVSRIDVLELRVYCPGPLGGAHGVWIDPFLTTGLTKTELDDYMKRKPYPVDLRILARIDGSDNVRFTSSETRWIHISWGHPTDVKVNGVDWNPRDNPVLKNGSLSQLLGKQVEDMVRMKKILGRNRAELACGKDFVTVIFDDTEPGGDLYEVILTFWP